jgi:putative ABC transport system permease protein
MSIWRLVFREIAFRKLNFGLSLLAATMAVACLAVVVTLLHQHDLVTDEIMQKHEDDIRKSMLNMSFNLLIIPKDQDRGALFAKGPSKYMPESYAQKLAKADLMSINHLLPSLREWVTWKERGQQVLLFGTRGEIGKGKKKQLLDAVPAGKVVLGYELHHGGNIKKGDLLKFTFTRWTGAAIETLDPVELRVHELKRQEGREDDVTVWVNLADAQRILNRPKLINGLLALQCECGKDRMGKIRADIAKVLPETQVLEERGKALARAEARSQAAELRQASRQQQEEFAGLLLPLVVLGCTVLLGVLAFVNVQDRVTEIGILRALGVSSIQVFGLFLVKAAIAGLLGALTGYALGTASGTVVGEAPAEMDYVPLFVNPWLMVVVLAAAPLWCALASVLPALRAARQDPALVLQQD